MKKTRFFMYAVLAAAMACVLVLAGCPKDAAGPEPDPALIGSWTNDAGGGLHAGLVKTFTINDDFTFRASINPVFIGAYNTGYKTGYDAAIENGADEAAADAAGKTAGAAALANLESSGAKEADVRWTVTGKLIADDGGLYLMNNLVEQDNKPLPGEGGSTDATIVLAAFQGHPVMITFNTAKTAFTFKSASSPENLQVTAFFGDTYTKVTN
jgi:hypothetical protein